MSKYYDKEQLPKECTITFEKQIPIVIDNKTYYCDIEVLKLLNRLNDKVELLEYNRDKTIEYIENLQKSNEELQRDYNKTIDFGIYETDNLLSILRGEE